MNISENFLSNGPYYNAVNIEPFDDSAVTEPVALQEAKDYAKIDVGTADDAIITYLITTARQQCEDFTGISIVGRTVTTYITNRCGGVFLPYGPVKSITSITDQDGNALVADQDYKIAGKSFPQILWPKWDNMTVVYTTGYTTLPQEIKSAILQQIFYLYENRGESAVISRSGVVAELTLSPQAKATLQRFRRVG